MCGMYAFHSSFNFPSQESGDVEEEWQLFRSAVMGCPEEAWIRRQVEDQIRKGSYWWCEEVKCGSS